LDVGQLTLDDGQLCPAELEQALQGDSLLLMACSAGYYQLAQVHIATLSCLPAFRRRTCVVICSEEVKYAALFFPSL